MESLRINRTKSKQVVCGKVVKLYTEARPTSDQPRPQDRPDPPHHRYKSLKPLTEMQ